MKITVKLDEADIREAITQYLQGKDYAVGKVSIRGHHDPGDPPLGPKSWVDAEAEVSQDSFAGSGLATELNR